MRAGSLTWVIPCEGLRGSSGDAELKKQRVRSVNADTRNTVRNTNAEIDQLLTINRQRSRSLEVLLTETCFRFKSLSSIYCNTGNSLYTKTHPACCMCAHVFLTSVARLSCVSTVTLAVCLAQAWHSTLSVFTARQTAGISCILVLLITEYARKTGLAAAGVGVGVDWKAGAMDTPEGGETGKIKTWTG